MPKLRSLRRRWIVLPMVVVLFLLAPGTALAAGSGEAATMPSWLHYLERFFIVLTAGVVAFGILIVEVEALHWAWGKIRGAKRSSGLDAQDRLAEAGPLPWTSVPRFDIHQRIQHFLLMGSFIVLAVTGISEKFYRLEPFGSMIALMGGMDTVRLIHRLAGGVMIADGIYHMLYLAPRLMTVQSGTPLANAGRWLEMIPSRKDFQDFFKMMSYFLGMSPRPPAFGRYSYMQKFDYWAVFWGLTVMAGSGLIMLLPALGVDFMGTAVIAAALAAHSDEAILAVAWILIVHLYHAHLSPRIFPFNTTIFTGRIPTALLMEEHSLEYARLVTAMDGEEPPSVPQEAPIQSPANGG